MTTYYYHKDKYGKELCHEVESIAEDCQQRLELMGDDAAMCVTTIREDDVLGYSSMDDFYHGEVCSLKVGISLTENGNINLGMEDNSDDEYNAMKEYLDNGGNYPFSLVTHRDGSVEAMNESDVDWLELANEYDDPGHYRIQPGYYEEGDITPETADKAGMYALAEALRGDEDETDEDDEENPLADVIDHWEYYPAWMDVDARDNGTTPTARLRAWYHDSTFTDTELTPETLPENPETSRIMTTEEALEVLESVRKSLDKK